MFVVTSSSLIVFIAEWEEECLFVNVCLVFQSDSDVLIDMSELDSVNCFLTTYDA